MKTEVLKDEGGLEGAAQVTVCNAGFPGCQFLSLLLCVLGSFLLIHLATLQMATPGLGLVDT